MKRCPGKIVVGKMVVACKCSEMENGGKKCRAIKVRPSFKKAGRAVA